MSELTPIQKFQNALLDLEIEMAHRYNKLVDEYNKAELERWEEEQKVNPWAVCNLIMDPPKVVMGIRYVQ